MRTFKITLFLCSSFVLSGAASGQPPPSPQTGERTYTVFVRGVPVGSERVTLDRTTDGWVIGSTARLGPPVNLITRRFEARYDSDWKPVSVEIDAIQNGAVLTLKTTISDGQAVNEVSQAGKSDQRTHTVSSQTVMLPNAFYAAYEGLVAHLRLVEAGDSLPVYVAPQAEIDLKVNEVTDETIQAPTGTVTTRRYMATFKNPGGEVPVVVWIASDGRLLRVSLPSAAVEVAREDVATVAARELKISRPGDEDSRINANGFNLAATISKPGDVRPGTRLPAIVLVPGSGSLDRDEVVAGIPIFGQLAGHLADAGFLVVRYDKRGVGQSGGRTEAATLSDYADDVRAVVRYLDKRKDVDKKRIAVVGHSEGGSVGLLAASREKKIAALVLIAAPGTSGADLVLEQQQHALDQLPIAVADREAKVELQRKIHQAILSGTGWEDIPEDLRKQADTPWFASFLRFDPAAIMRKVRQPILTIAGELDRQVPPHHANRLQELAQARKKKVPADKVLVPGINHLLVPATTGEVSEYTGLTDHQISLRVPEAIVAWLNTVMRAGPS